MPTLNLTDVGTVVVSATPLSLSSTGSVTLPSSDQLLTYPEEGDEMQLTRHIDFIEASNLIYVGEALPGTAKSASTWRIKRINTEAGTDSDIEILYADGDAGFNNTWDDRLSLTYT